MTAYPHSHISRDEALMETACIWANRSTCPRLHVGAVFSSNGRILVQGYNGAPAGLPHCEHEWWTLPKGRIGTTGAPKWVQDYFLFVGYPPAHGQYLYLDNGTITHKTGEDAQVVTPPCTRAEHAERNGIAWAARKGVRLEGSELHVTHMPCVPCSMAVVNAGVERVVYREAYRITEGVELMRAAGLEVVDFQSLIA